ncbi:glycosyltransferase (plasmid) [Phyllobacterium sp. 628]|uniref:glycosyltransferase n=1 Tax=Phyllobacterium sp. 628 TaxID=2718938 RepID=UPI001662504E|nr:glycosyltransferase [Phyllobacterium sp. 628]QND54519.1 glycosyltransferase [Phyllobacterium sp. 628]
MFDKTRRIALFIPTLQGGGAERSTVNLANGLVREGYSIDLLLSKAEGPFLSDVDPLVRIIELATTSVAKALVGLAGRPSDLFGLAHLLLTPRSPKPLAVVPDLVRYLTRERPVAILSALEYANVALIIASGVANVDTRVVISQRNQFSAQTGQFNNWREMQRGPAFGRFYSRADCIIAVSNGVANDLAEACQLPAQRIKTIYNAVSGHSLSAMAAQRVDHPWFDSGLPVILAVGKHKRQKDFPTLLRAFAEVRKVRNCRLMILGDGPERSNLEDLSHALDIVSDVAFLGFMHNPFGYMTRADLFVLSSAFEGLPGVLIQALACGCPVISTDCPSGPKEILDHGKFGTLVPVGDFHAMSKAIVVALDKPLNKNLLQKRGEVFSTDGAVQAYLKVLLG